MAVLDIELPTGQRESGSGDRRFKLKVDMSWLPAGCCSRVLAARLPPWSGYAVSSLAQVASGDGILCHRASKVKESVSFKQALPEELGLL